MMEKIKHPVLRLLQPGKKLEGDWFDFPIPGNITVGKSCMIDSSVIFKNFFSVKDPGLRIGENVTIRNSNLATEENGLIEIGNFTFIFGASIVCRELISIGNYVYIAGGVNIVDSDFHPLSPAERLADTVALSPAGDKSNRPLFISQPVIIEDEVWIGYNATILKGIRIGKAAIIQPGSVVTKDVKPGEIVSGNPAQTTTIKNG